jgi:hypothetical protein
MKNKIKRGFLPIYSKDIKRLIGYCDTWGYGNKTLVNMSPSK